MSIKSDRWIRRMAQEHRMIEPFESGQVRELDGKRIVSYGTSSYGYDIRCSDEFKIFTNINSTIVDPKEFDEKSFVDFKGPVCIIPPNSFALARTVEYFRIPRNVLTICMGKCLTADTRVVDAESGAYLPIAEFAWGRKTLSLKDWRLQAAPVSGFIAQGVKPVFELKTRSGLRIKATANHPFRQLHGWTELSRLTPGDRIAVARSVPVFGRTPIPDREAALLGLDVGAAGRFVPQSIFTAPERSVRLFLQALFTGHGGLHRAGGGFFLEYPAKSRRVIEDVHHLLLRFGIVSLIRERKTSLGADAFEIRIADVEQIGRFAERVGFVHGSVQQRRLEQEILPAMRLASASESRAGMRLRAAGLPRAAEPVAMAPGDAQHAPLVGGPVWDAVESIVPAGEDEVFDLTVPRTHNFLANDIVVHNSTYARCGIIVNVTPFEPEWEGYVTLEFSNTTPLPAKIYANEGVAQVVFFESDEVCETSYRDRGGKYQGQKGVTLPKM